ncbi:isochorismatase family cysteine hydrolase [Hoeflea sp.]|uniref:cysteine hydrolase family protein n=1 Tax=Hoeflea sp. TaxID=1940281 RepID=UPI0019A266F8|nr:isochorismatase family cysteine hydrolase [Hoeflea sp.]MBC7281060.1 cysteine hydrolase [Hoeflea sp.]
MVDVFSAHRQDGEAVLDTSKTALVIIDMINEFCKPGGKMVLPGYEQLMPQQKALIATARKNGVPVIFVVDSHRKNMRRDREWVKRTPHGIENTWATQVIEDLEVQKDDIIVVKHRYSAFFQTDLDLVLKDMLISQLVVCGVVTNICVRSTVHDAFFEGYDVVVPHDACAATGPREHVSTLYDIATHFGVVADTAAVIAGLSSGQPIANHVFEDVGPVGLAAQ